MENLANEKKYDLEDRLIEFTAAIFNIVDNMFDTKAGNHIAGQIVRSGSNPGLHYGEAQSAESRRDFIHKLKVLLKELRETRAALKIINRTRLTKRIDLVEETQPEYNQLIAIFMASIKTAKKNMEEEQKKSKTVVLGIILSIGFASNLFFILC